jgi:hypothetical protein
MTRPTDEHIRWGDPSYECPNCTESTDQTDTEDESHWTVAYKYKCPNCGCEYWWSQAECDDGLKGWELIVMDWGDIRKRDGLNDYYKRDEHFSLSKLPTPCEYNTCYMVDEAWKNDFGEDHYCQDCTRNPEVQGEIEEANK